MTTDAPTYPQHAQRLSPGRLWFGTLAAACAWVLHGLGGFFISWQACQDGDDDWGVLSGLEVRWLIGGYTLGLLAVAVIACALSFSNWRRLADSRRITRSEAKGREEFLALAGVFIGLSFTVGIVWGGLGPLLLDVCVTAK